MLKKLLLQHKLKKSFFIRTYIILITFIILVMFSIFYFQLSRAHTQELNQLSIEQANQVELLSKGIFNHFYDISTDVNVLYKYIKDRDIKNYRYSKKHAIAELFYNFALSKGRYNQIRLIDTDGMEQVRVNFQKGTASIVPEKNLQNKKHRYYFTESISLLPHSIYLSRLDLNIESNEIIQPIIPMLRIGKPVYNKAGDKIGVLLLNYFGQHMLNQLELTKQDKFESIQLLNADSYWLKSDIPEQNWGFMYPDKKSIRFKDRYPGVWKTMITTGSGTIFKDKQMFSYTTLYPLMELYKRQLSQNHTEIDISDLKKKYFWILIITTNQAGLKQVKTKVFSDQGFYIILGIPIAVFMVFIISLLVARLKYTYDEMEQLAMLDPLTGLYNRRSLFKRLDEEMNRSRRTRSSIGFVMIDIDYFKNFNDKYGHIIGDEVLRITSDTIRNISRDMDTVGRYGGEEIAIIVPGCTITSLHDMCERIRLAVEKSRLHTEYGPLSITISAGASCFNLLLLDNIDNNTAIIEFADAALYQAKQQGKNRVVMG